MTERSFTTPLVFALLLALLAGGPALAQEEKAQEDEKSKKELEDIVRRQDEELDKLKKEVRDLRGQDAVRLEKDITAYLESTADEVDARPPSYRTPQLYGLGRVRLGGYLSLELRDDGDGSNLHFDLHRLVLKLAADIAEGISFETEIEIEGGGADVGFLSGNEILVEFAEVRWELAGDLVIFKAGALLVPWGRFNFFHDDPYQDLTDRPLVARYIGSVAFDQPGIGVEGSIELVKDAGWFLDYDTAVTNGFAGDPNNAAVGFTTNSGTRSARQSFRDDNNNNKQVWARVVLSIPVKFLDMIEIGASGHYGKWDPMSHDADYGYGIEIALKRGPFEAVAEYMNMRIEQPAGAAASEPRRMDGWYVELAYHFFPSAWRGSHLLFTQESTFTFVVRLEEIDLNHSTSGSTFRDDLRRVTIGFNFRPVERNVFKISYAWVDSKLAGQVTLHQFVMSWATYF